MRSPFLTFTVIFIAVVGIAAGVFVASRRQPPAPVAKPIAAVAKMPVPPDVSGLNAAEVPIPGTQLNPAPPPDPGDYVAELAHRNLTLPIAGLHLKDLTDTFHDKRGTGEHEAIDIMEPKGTPVHAVDEGNIVKLFTSQRGGLTIYQFDDARSYCYYYAHLDRYADGIKEGTVVRAGDIIGFVGMSGDAPVPHLHFALSRIGPDQKWWISSPLDPYPVLVKLAAP